MVLDVEREACRALARASSSDRFPWREAAWAALLWVEEADLPELELELHWVADLALLLVAWLGLDPCILCRAARPARERLVWLLGPHSCGPEGVGERGSG